MSLMSVDAHIEAQLRDGCAPNCGSKTPALRHTMSTRLFGNTIMPSFYAHLPESPSLSIYDIYKK